jgi:Na+/serine symporter
VIVLFVVNNNMVVCNIKSTYTQVLALLCLMESGIYSLFGTLVVH